MMAKLLMGTLALCVTCAFAGGVLAESTLPAVFSSPVQLVAAAEKNKDSHMKKSLKKKNMKKHKNKKSNRAKAKRHDAE